MPRFLMAVLGLLVTGCDRPGPEPSAATAAEMPHAVLVDDGSGKRRHVHIASLVRGGRLASGFGSRLHPMGGDDAPHKGIDIAARKGAPVRAAAGGRIVDKGWRGAYGRFIRIRHSDRHETVYAHLSRFARGLKVGRRITQDSVIGYVGSTGRSTGPHLHFEIRDRDRAINPLDLPRVRHGRSRPME